MLKEENRKALSRPESRARCGTRVQEIRTIWCLGSGEAFKSGRTVLSKLPDGRGNVHWLDIKSHFWPSSLPERWTGASGQDEYGVKVRAAVSVLNRTSDLQCAWFGRGHPT